ncbi:MAG: hypothetical protein D6820_06065, partial [Lentisphaerae bacterium]
MHSWSTRLCQVILPVSTAISPCITTGSDSTNIDLAQRIRSVHADYSSRAQALLDGVAALEIDWKVENSYKLAPMVASACFATGADERARQILFKHSRIKPMVRYFDPEFPLYSTMHCYMQWKDVPGKYTPELKEAIRHYVCAATEPSSAVTYNHHWMLATGLILARQEWGDAVQYKFRNRAEPGDETGKLWAKRELERILLWSHGEALSPTYCQFSFGPMLPLYEHAKDPELSQRCRKALDYILVRLASFHFNGHCAGTTGRTYWPVTSQSDDVPPAWLYFGGPGKPLGLAVVPMALASYRAPAAIARLAWDRKEVYLQKATRGASGRKVRLLSFFNRSYVLFSEYLVNNYAGPRDTWFHERLSWAVRWQTADPRQASTFFIKHPCPKTRNHRLGDTPYNQVLQWQGSLIGLCRIPGTRPHPIDPKRWCPWILGVFPATPHMIDESNDGQIWLHYGSVMIAVKLNAPFTLTEVDHGEKGKLREFKI